MNVTEDFKAYIDGEATPAERLRVDKHLAENPADRAAFDDLQRLSKAIREYVTQPEPVGLEKTLTALAAAKPNVRRQRLWRQQLVWLGAAAGCLLVVAALFPVFAQNKESAARLSLRGVNSSADTAPSTNGDVTLPPSDGAGEASAKSSRASGAVPIGGALSQHGASAGAGGNSYGQFASAGKLKSEMEPDSSSTPPRGPSGRAPLVQKNAAMTVDVKDVAGAQHNVENTTRGLGGFVQTSNRSEAKDQSSEADLVIRVPVRQYEEALNNIRALGNVVSESSNGNDVTADVVDMEARLKVLRAEESDYLTLLTRARSIASIMAIRDKLTEIRSEIESITAERNTTKDMAAMSTIQVTLRKVSPTQPESKSEGDNVWLNDTWSTAVGGLGSAGKVLAQLLIFLVVWAPIWVPTTLLGAWVYRKLRW